MIKDFLSKQSVRLMQDPRVQKLMQDERVMKAMMKGIQVRGDVQDRVEQRIDSVAETLNLVTKKELRELKRTMRKMEQELKKAKKKAEALEKAAASA